MVNAPSAVDPVTFPKARQGYQRSAVDRYATDLRQRLAGLADERSALTAENARLTGALAALRVTYDRLRTAELDERARDVIGVAEQKGAELVARGERSAADLVRQAQREAQVITERARQEVAWSKRRLRSERADLAAQQQALQRQLNSLRDLAVDTAQQFPEMPELSFAEMAAGETPGLPCETASQQQHA